MVCENLHWILSWTLNKQRPPGHYGALTALRTPGAVVIQNLPQARREKESFILFVQHMTP